MEYWNEILDISKIWLVCSIRECLAVCLYKLNIVKCFTLIKQHRVTHPGLYVRYRLKINKEIERYYYLTKKTHRQALL